MYNSLGEFGIVYRGLLESDSGGILASVAVKTLKGNFYIIYVHIFSMFMVKANEHFENSERHYIECSQT